MLSLKQLRDVCLTGQGSKQCRYLRPDDQDYQKYYCMKKKPTDRRKIDTKVSEYLHDCKKRSLDPDAQGHPLGDNCEGYPVLKYIEQGYDKP